MWMKPFTSRHTYDLMFAFSGTETDTHFITLISWHNFSQAYGQLKYFLDLDLEDYVLQDPKLERGIKGPDLVAERCVCVSPPTSPKITKSKALARLSASNHKKAHNLKKNAPPSEKKSLATDLVNPQQLRFGCTPSFLPHKTKILFLPLSP